MTSREGERKLCRGRKSSHRLVLVVAVKRKARIDGQRQARLSDERGLGQIFLEVTGEGVCDDDDDDDDE